MPFSSSLSEQILVTANRFCVDATGNILPEHESIIENRHLGWLTVTNRQGHILYSTPGAEHTATFFRSSGKPFQAFPLVESGFYQQLSTPELALTCASHTSSKRHMEIAAGILKKAGLNEEALQCGPHPPTDQDMANHLRLTGQAPTKLFNNCSGKHAGMLFYCHMAGLDPHTYLQPQHPLQQHILNTVRQWGGVQDVPLAIDGCGAPIFQLPLTSMARLYAHLGSSPEFIPLQQAMTTHPDLVGGEGRVDTSIMQATQGELLAKVGADGVLCVARVGADEGLALKLSDGSTEVRDMALVQILIQLGWLTGPAIQDTRLQPFLNKKYRQNTQARTVGDYHILLPRVEI
jgi:L-asparaginase II